VYQYQTSTNDINACTNNTLVSGSVSMLVVDDGSSDGTAQFIRDRSWLAENTTNCDSMLVNNYWSVDPIVNVITLPQNSGKGAAIERGMMELPSSFGIGPYGLDTSITSLVLVADADGSGDISSIHSMLRCLEEMLSNSMSSTKKWTDHSFGYPALVVGYRQNLEPKSPLRALLSQGFRSSVSLLFWGQELGVRDTQCGFKLMTVSAGKILYNQLNLRRWTQDVEVIYRARLLDIPVGECGVGWVDMGGSKLIMKKSDALIVSLAMFGEIANMRLQYALGNWFIS
jgi:dolichyl-phosphate beta-glucosyltransferase